VFTVFKADDLKHPAMELHPMDSPDAIQLSDPHAERDSDSDVRKLLLW